MSSLGVPPFSHWMGFCVVVDVVVDVVSTVVLVPSDVEVETVVGLELGEVAEDDMSVT